MVGVTHYLILSGILFSIGLTGSLMKRNVVTVLMCVEIMFNAVILSVLAFARFAPATQNGGESTTPFLTGQTLALFIIVVAAAEVALGLAIVIAIFRNRNTVDITAASDMKG